MITKCRCLWYLSCFLLCYLFSPYPISFLLTLIKQNVSQSGIWGLVAANRRPDYC